MPVKSFETRTCFDWLKLNKFNNGRLIDKPATIFKWLHRRNALSPGNRHYLQVLKCEAPFVPLLLYQRRPISRSRATLPIVCWLFFQQSWSSEREFALCFFCEGLINTISVVLVPNNALLLDPVHLYFDSYIQHFLGAGHLRLSNGWEDQTDETRCVS